MVQPLTIYWIHTRYLTKVREKLNSLFGVIFKYLSHILSLLSFKIFVLIIFAGKDVPIHTHRHTCTSVFKIDMDN